MDLTIEQARERGGYGEERYEKEEFQQKVRDKFLELERLEGEESKKEEDERIEWVFVNAARDQETIHHEIVDLATTAIQNKKSSTIKKLWI